MLFHVLGHLAVIVILDDWQDVFHYSFTLTKVLSEICRAITIVDFQKDFTDFLGDFILLVKIWVLSKDFPSLEELTIL